MPIQDHSRVLMHPFSVSALILACLTVVSGAKPSLSAPADPFSALTIYGGEWSVRSIHPWSGKPVGAVDTLSSRCHRFTKYFACEQTINGKPASLIVYTTSDTAGMLHTRTITPDGLAGGRGDLLLAGAHWTYIDRPPATLKGDWSRTENFITDQDHIHFEEYVSSDEGGNWKQTNAGDEQRRPM